MPSFRSVSVRFCWAHRSLPYFFQVAASLELEGPPSSIVLQACPPPPLDPPLPVEPGTQSLLFTCPVTPSQQVLQIWPLALVVSPHLGGGFDGVGWVPQQVYVIDW